MGAIVGKAQRIGQPGPGEGQAGLAREEGQGLHRAQAQGMGAPLEQARGHQARHIGGVHRPVADAALRGLDLHQGLEGEQSAGAVADEAHPDPGGLRGGGDGRGHLIGAHGHGGHVAGDIDPQAHRPSSAARASRRAPASRATGTSSTRAAGPLAHRPRQ